MSMAGRTFSAGSYRFGFNGQEKSTEIFEGSTTALFWEYDSRIGRRWNVDPVISEGESPYLCFKGDPIHHCDPDGDCAICSAFQEIKNWFSAPASKISTGMAREACKTLAGDPGDHYQPSRLQAFITILGSGAQAANQNGIYSGKYFASRSANRSSSKTTIPKTTPQTPKTNEPSTAETVKIAPTNEKTVKTVTVTRVQTQHKLSQRISVNEAGDVSIVGNTKLYVTIDDQNHVNYYYNKKGGSEGGASVVSFQVTKEVADDIRCMAVPQKQAKANPDMPEIADPTKSNSAYGLPANYIEKLKKGIVKGTGKVETP